MEEIQAGKLLAGVNFPADLRKIPEEMLEDFCNDLRQYIIEHVSLYGGHFGASLGVVELTAALHYVYNTPDDQLVWDVGHQAYGHKIITGRRERFHTNRLLDGISGFPKRSESEYDSFGVGHSSTSISAALGMAVAMKKSKDPRHVVAVIGDGAMTGGMSFEALNHGGVENTDLLVILNDNCMSIDPNVGALKEYLTDISSSKTFNKIRDEAWKLFSKLDRIGGAAKVVASKIEDLFTTAISKPGMLFESLGWRYFGPIDGHDVFHLVRILRDLQKIKGPKLLHIVTVKGKGFAPAEKDQTKWHAQSSPFDKLTGASLAKAKPQVTSKPPKYQDVFGQTIIELAEINPKIYGITPAMPSGSSMLFMLDKMPERAFDVGISEQHAVTFSAGMATQGLRPFCNIYSTFMQRAYDQVIHDVAIQNLPVIFCLDRGGLAGSDGPTHHGNFDLAYFRCIPNMIVAAPMNESELRNMMYSAQLDETVNPYSIRYPRGEGVLIEWRTPFEKIETGTGRMISDGEEIAILTIGHPGNFAVEAIRNLGKDGIVPAHFDLRFVKPLDGELLEEIFSRFPKIITVEDACIQGGFGSAILEYMADHKHSAEVIRLGIPDEVIEHGTQQELWKLCGYDAEAIADAVRQLLGVQVHG